jgi:methylaspartate mutase epsilon subunit
MAKAHRLLIGSLGDDIHSVGMALLTIAFRESGFAVRNLGIGNSLEEFFRHAPDHDAIFISCNNGHVDLYLEEFPLRLAAFRSGIGVPKVWYLGGNLSVKDDAETLIRRYREFGFDFVAPKPVAWTTILEKLRRDLHLKGIDPATVGDNGHDQALTVTDLDTVNDRPMSNYEFHATRREVLASWPTGSAVWLADVKRNHAAPQKNLHAVIAQSQAAPQYRPLLQPRTGVAHISDEIAILKLLRENGLDVSSIQLDAASRKNLYAKAQEGVERTEAGKISFLNGFPVPIHGVAGMEEILRAIETPFQIRAGSPDHRLVYEIGLAGGASSLEGGFLCYLFPYDKLTSPVTSLRYWKYIDRLTGIYRRSHGITINREYFGPLTTSLIAPSIAIAVNIVQAILSARSGVDCISVGLAEQGCRVQDIAAIRALDKLTRSYLAKYGHAGCTVSTVYHQYMAAFPTDRDKARQLIQASSVTGTLARATKFMLKTPVESIQIPTKEDNAEALQLTRAGVADAAQTTVDRTVVASEQAVIEREVVALMQAIEELGCGSVARGAIRAFQDGILDIPFSPSRYNRNRVITARDCDGAIRFVNPELLPFDAEIVEHHRERIHRRMVAERVTKTAEMIERDLTRVWKNDFLRWPLDGVYVI